MPNVALSYIGGAGWQFLDDSGNPLSGGKLYTYIAGTTTEKATYTSNEGTTQNPYPLVLDAAGRPPAEVWVEPTTTTKFVLKDSEDSTIRTYDNIPTTGSTIENLIVSGNFTLSTAAFTVENNLSVGANSTFTIGNFQPVNLTLETLEISDVGDLTIEGDLNMTNGAITSTASTSVTGNIVLQNGDFTGTSLEATEVNVTGTGDFGDATISGNVTTTTLSTSGTLDVETVTMGDNATINQTNGSVTMGTVTASGNIDVTGNIGGSGTTINATLDLNITGDINNANTINVDGDIAGLSSLHNSGALNCTTLSVTGDVNNEGSLTVTNFSGTLVDQTAPSEYAYVVEIGDWNMDSSATATITLPGPSSDIVDWGAVSVLIRDDNNSQKFVLNTPAAGGGDGGYLDYMASTGFVVGRYASGYFDSVLFDSTSYNRGWAIYTPTSTDILTTPFPTISKYARYVLDIGAWNMDTTAGVSIAEPFSGFFDYYDVLSISGTILADSGAYTPDRSYPFISRGAASISAWGVSAYISYPGNTIELGRETSGFFDSTNFNDGVMNRGYVVLEVALKSAIPVRKQTINIGSWNMDLTGIVSINHGLDFDKIIGCTITIVDDFGEKYPFLITASGGGGGYVDVINTTQIVLGRFPGGMFDNSSFDDTGINRGFITLWATI